MKTRTTEDLARVPRENLIAEVLRLDVLLARDAENAGASLAGGVAGLHLVGESKGLKPVDDADAFLNTIRLDSPVNLARRVADAKNIGAGAGAVRIGFFFDQGQDFLVYGEWLYFVNELRLHGLIPPGDGMGYVLKYLRKWIEGAPA